MASEQPNQTPYDPEQPTGRFAGRAEALTWLHGQLTGPAPTAALTVIGRERLGKSALLIQLEAAFNPDVIGLHFPLRATPLHNEAIWLKALYTAAVDALLQRGYSPTRLPEPPPSTAASALRDWLREEGLPALYHVVRAHRRFVYLFDDAAALVEAVDRGDLPPDSVDYLHSLLGPQLYIVLTLTENDDLLARLAPLADPLLVYRLTQLDADELRLLFPGTSDAVAAALFRATGGHPALSQRLGDYLWQEQARQFAARVQPESVSLEPVTLDAVKAAVDQVYARESAYFRSVWQRLDGDAQLVLTAMAELLYENPLRPITAAAIESWLVETDYPMDLTSIHAALRGLEYREIVHQSAEGVQIISGLWQRWLLDHALRSRPTGPVSTTAAVNSAEPPNKRVLWAAVAAGLLVLVLVVAAIALSGGPTPSANEIVPTATLLGGG